MRYSTNKSFELPERTPSNPDPVDVVNLTNNWERLDSMLVNIEDDAKDTKDIAKGAQEIAQTANENAGEAKELAINASENLSEFMDITRENLENKLDKEGVLEDNYVLVTGINGKVEAGIITVEELQYLRGLSQNIQEFMDRISGAVRDLNYLRGFRVILVENDFPEQEIVDEEVKKQLEIEYPEPTNLDAVYVNVVTANASAQKALLYVWFEKDNDWVFLVDRDILIFVSDGETYGVVNSSDEIAFEQGKGKIVANILRFEKDNNGYWQAIMPDGGKEVFRAPQMGIYPNLDGIGDLGAPTETWNNAYFSGALSADTVTASSDVTSPMFTGTNNAIYNAPSGSHIFRYNGTNTFAVGRAYAGPASGQDNAFDLGQTTARYRDAYLGGAITAASAALSGLVSANSVRATTDMVGRRFVYDVGQTYIGTTSGYNVQFIYNNSNVVAITGSTLQPNETITGTYDLGTATARWRDLYLSRDATIAGTLTTQRLLYSGGPIYIGSISDSNVQFIQGNVNRVAITSSTLQPNTAQTGTMDLGLTTARWRDIWASRNITAPTLVATSGITLNGETITSWAGAGSDIDLTAVTTNIFPASNNFLNLGRDNNRWSEAYVTSIRCAQILPFQNFIGGADIGSTGARFRTVYTNNLNTSGIQSSDSITLNAAAGGNIQLSLNGVTYVVLRDDSFGPLTGHGSELELGRAGLSWKNVHADSYTLNGQTITEWPSGGGSGKRYATVVVGNMNSGHTLADCDFLCQGSQDDDVINKAIRSVDGGSVILLEGDYYVDNYISPQPNISLLGQGSATVIHKQFERSNTGAIEMTSYSNVSNLSIDCEDGTGYGIYAFDCRNCNIKDCQIYNSGTGGIYLYKTEDVNVIGNSITGNANTISRVSKGIILGGESLKNCKIENNIVKDVNGAGISIADNMTDAIGTIVSGNRVSNANWGIYCVGINGAQIENIIIIGNSTCENIYDGIQLGYCRNITVTGNMCNKNKLYGINNTGQSTQHTITGNTCNENMVAGIYLASSSAINSTIVGNTVRGNAAAISGNSTALNQNIIANNSGN